MTPRAVAYKLKVAPEDFQVEEDAELPLLPAGPFRVYRLRKRGWTTADVAADLTRRRSLVPGALSWGGRKDRHAATVQYVSIADARDLSEARQGYELEAIGCLDRPMGPDLLRGNRFSVTLRALVAGEQPLLRANLAALTRWGFLNYFDDQRFGSWHPEAGFVARMLLVGGWEAALKTHLTLPLPADPRPVREHKREIAPLWWDWPACLAAARGDDERRVFRFLRDRGANYPAALNLLARETLSLLLAAYQSDLWNQTAEELLRVAAVDLLPAPGVVRPYLLPVAFGPDAHARLRALTVPTLDARCVPADPEVAAAQATVLARAGLEQRDFRLKAVWRAYFRSTPRALLVTPANLEVDDPAADERYPGRLRLTLRFTLPPGAYATMLVKRLAVLPP